jgi:hypothetical protein
MTGEFVRGLVTISSKQHKDLLKSVLVSKAHLNDLLERLSYIDTKSISKVKLPIIQVMGLTYTIYSLNAIEKKLYSLQKVTEFNYPCTLREVKAEDVNKMLDGFACIQVSGLF